ncbi:MAG TPA: methyltransferase domain-containing protein [Burkholderiales bacterium]
MANGTRNNTTPDGATRDDAWVQASGYEFYVGRWSRPVADKFLQWIAVPPGRAWLDVGCGTGALSERILARYEPERLVGVDPSDGFLSHARAHTIDERAEFYLGDAQALPVADRSVDAAVSGLVLNFVRDPARAAAEMRRTTRTGGKVAAYVWDYAGDMQMMRRFWDAAVALDSAARDLDEGVRFPLCRPDPLRALFTAAGLHEVAVCAIDTPTVFMNFDDYWSPFFGGQGPAPGYCMSLPEEARAALRERIRATLPIERDGKIRLTARAWAVQGVV